ncbi:MAG: N-acetyltransferase [Bradyrhizobium sp.]|uniref:GNAT family N-acetyltransferase n=1 Tax=Bradyrhizobium sp. TaxID=376 RepID=UPI001C283054|nr:N-acetyltransferase [Bradyrhizobium sp.]MBU6463918.1 N-acetyltransferase [Pseudomonadota bacterium]MDE2067724.1 N-acetyltransferase [Bradyrhizobium sp.]MDE2242058.1 N-acetyltransferase [Bradyrhizobium sp.]MDE2471659.1 N-acetyltransferase [Bradyrhizobium sp.]
MLAAVASLPQQHKQPSRITIRGERRSDVAAREALLNAAFGPGRFAKSSERLREGRVPARGLAFTAVDGKRLIGTVRLWSVTAGNAKGCLLLGPLAVVSDVRSLGVGAGLMWRALREAKRRGYRAVLLVGDPAYYQRFGFSAENTGALLMPGPYERDRLLAREFVPGTLAGARGMISADRPRPPRFAGIFDSVVGGRIPIAQPV